jgi:hypothetical protein
MNTTELEQRLLDEGCNPSSFAIGRRGGASDAFCLMFDDTSWQVFYTERGIDQKPIFTNNDEAEACAFFLQHITSFRHPHLVGFFRSRPAADAMMTALKREGLDAWQDGILYRPDDWRYRVFVEGKAIFQVRRLFASLPLED